MTIDTDNVLVGEAQLYVAPYGSGGEPLPNMDTVLLGTPWGGNWVAMGGTMQGVKFSKNPKTVDIRIEEQSPPVNVLIDTQDISVMTSLSEDTIANMKVAYGGGIITTVAAASGVVGKSKLVLSDTLDKLSIGFEGQDSAGFYRRVYIPKVISAAQVDTEYRRAAQQRLYPTTFRAICAVNLIQIVEMTAAAT